MYMYMCRYMYMYDYFDTWYVDYMYNVMKCDVSDI